MNDTTQKPIPLARPRLGGAELAAVQRVIESRHLAQGPEVAALEREASALLGGRDVVAVTSGGSALFVSLAACGVGSGDEVVVPAFTFPAAAHAAAWLGATPVPADVDPETLAVTARSVRTVLTPRTRAVVVSHAFGIPADVEEVSELVSGGKATVVEDAACAFGGRTPGGRPTGTVGRLACFSLHPRKLVTAGEGGLVVCDETLSGKVRTLRDYGRTGSGFGDIFGDTGLNFRLSDLCAAVARVQLENLDRSITARAALCGRYQERLEGVKTVEVPKGYSRDGQTWQSFVVRIRSGARAVVERLCSLGIQAGPSAHDLSGQTFFRRRWGAGPPCPVSADLAGELLALPLFDEMTPAQVDTVVDALLKTIDEERG